MLRVILKKVAMGAVAATAMVSVAEGSPKSLQAFPGRDANNLVAKAHGSHSTCVYGEYREAAKRTEGWHQHLRGEAYRCTPGSPDKATGAPQRSPGDVGKGSEGDRGTGGDRGRRSDGDRGRTSGSTDSRAAKTSPSLPSPKTSPSRPYSKPRG